MTLLQMSKRPWPSFRGLSFNKLKQADQTSRLCVLFMCGEANKGELGPGGAEMIGQDRERVETCPLERAPRPPASF